MLVAGLLSNAAVEIASLFRKGVFSLFAAKEAGAGQSQTQVLGEGPNVYNDIRVLPFLLLALWVLGYSLNLNVEGS